MREALGILLHPSISRPCSQTDSSASASPSFHATCRAVFPGRITDNMVCCGEAGEDACQGERLQATPRMGGREGERGGVRVGGGEGKSERGDGERDEVRKKERHRKRQGESPGSGGQRQGAQVQSRETGWGTQRGGEQKVVTFGAQVGDRMSLQS